MSTGMAGAHRPQKLLRGPCLGLAYGYWGSRLRRFSHFGCNYSRHANLRGLKLILPSTLRPHSDAHNADYGDFASAPKRWLAS